MVLKSAGVTRVHIHHLMSMDIDARALVHQLGVPFDVTVHDYFAICPQVNLLPWPQPVYTSASVSATKSCKSNTCYHASAKSWY